MTYSQEVHGRGAAHAADYLSGWRRARADLANFHKQLHEHETRAQTAQLKNLLEPLLTLADNFRAMTVHLPADLKDHPWAAGVMHIARQLDTVLSQYNAQEIKAEGEQFNPHLHEAIAQVQRDDVPAGTIITVVQNGYLLRDEVLRPARVKVAHK
jgi:molecular chaperone GrpE